MTSATNNVVSSFAHLTLAVRDVSAASRFYAATLGWQPIARPNNIGRPAAWLQIGPHQELHLLEEPDFVASAFEREFGRHVAVNYPVARFDELKQRLVAEGAELIDPLRETPFARFFFRDPNGYVFEVVAEDRPTELSR